MTHLYIPPPSYHAIVSYCIKWLALNLRAKVTVTIWKSNSDNYTEEYDGSVERPE